MHTIHNAHIFQYNLTVFHVPLTSLTDGNISKVISVFMDTLHTTCEYSSKDNNFQLYKVCI